jgi:hypothetical protein
MIAIVIIESIPHRSDRPMPPSILIPNRRPRDTQLSGELLHQPCIISHGELAALEDRIGGSQGAELLSFFFFIFAFLVR